MDFTYVCVCVYSNSRKDVPRVAHKGPLSPKQPTNQPSGSAVRNHCRTHPVPCVRPRCVYSVLRAHAQFCRFDKADATADVQ